MKIWSPEEIRVAVLEFLEQRLRIAGMAVEEVDGTFPLFGSGILDSLGFVDLLLNIEQRLGQPLELDELDFNNLETLDAIVNQLHSLQNHRSMVNDG